MLTVRYTLPDGETGIHGRFATRKEAEEQREKCKRWFKGKAKVEIDGKEEEKPG